MGWRIEFWAAGFIALFIIIVALFLFLPRGWLPFEVFSTNQSYLALSKETVLQGEPIAVAVGVFGTGEPFSTGLSPSYYYLGYFLDGQFLGFERQGAHSYSWSNSNICTASSDAGCIYQYGYSWQTFPAFFRLVKGTYAYQLDSSQLSLGAHRFSVSYAPLHSGSDYRNESDLFQLGASCDAHLANGSSYGIDSCRGVWGSTTYQSRSESYACGGYPFDIPQSYWFTQQGNPVNWCNGCCTGSGGCDYTWWDVVGVKMSGKCRTSPRMVTSGFSDPIVLFERSQEQAMANIGWSELASKEFTVLSELPPEQPPVEQPVQPVVEPPAPPMLPVLAGIDWTFLFEILIIIFLLVWIAYQVFY